MPSQPPIPPLLASILSSLPYTSLTLVTSTLGATTSWLVVRFICAVLRGRGSEIGHGIPTIGENSHGQGVVLVSWLRDGSWWRDSGRKLVKGSYVLKAGLFCGRVGRIGADDCLRFQGIDFGKVQLVDGLSSGLGLDAGGIADVEKAIMKAIGRVESLNDRTGIILVLDGLDFLLAATECEMLRMLEMIGELREVHNSSNSLRFPAPCGDSTCLTQVPKNSTSIPPSLPQLPFHLSLNRVPPLSTYLTQLS